jgi:hypothetical protein
MRKATLPKTLLEREEEIRTEEGLAEDWSLLGTVIRSYNEEAKTLEEIGAQLNVPVSTLFGWLRSCGYEIETDRKIVPARPVVPVEVGQ